MLPSNKVCGYNCGFSNYFLNFKAIIVLFSSTYYDKNVLYICRFTDFNHNDFRLQRGITKNII